MKSRDENGPLSKAQLKVRLSPRAKQDRILGWLDSQILKIQVHAPPVDGKANQALVRFLAKALMIPMSSITIKTGQTSRNKLVEMDMISGEELAINASLRSR